MLAAVVGLAVAAPAQAAGYRYWSFWEQDKGAWSYATMGPSQTRPSDGDVEGFRFAVSADSKDAAQPRGSSGFDTICSGTPAQDGKKRVGVVIDFGTKTDAPSGETPPKAQTGCALVGEDATAADALAAVAKPLRYDSSAMLCAISGYPRTGCGEQVSTGQETDAPGTDHAAAKKSGGSGPSVGVLAGVAAVAVLGAGAIWQAKRRRG
nr:SCO2322 family protein [Streptomyces sp. SID8379]